MDKKRDTNELSSWGRYTYINQAHLVHASGRRLRIHVVPHTDRSCVYDINIIYPFLSAETFDLGCSLQFHKSTSVYRYHVQRKDPDAALLLLLLHPSSLLAPFHPSGHTRPVSSRSRGLRSLRSSALLVSQWQYCLPRPPSARSTRRGRRCAASQGSRSTAIAGETQPHAKDLPVGWEPRRRAARSSSRRLHHRAATMRQDHHGLRPLQGEQC